MMRNMKKRLLTIALLALAGCQSKAEALQMVCDAPNQPAVQNASADDRMKMMMQQLDSDVSNREVIEMFESFAHIAPDAKRLVIKRELDTVGITKCAMLGVLEGEEKK